MVKQQRVQRTLVRRDDIAVIEVLAQGPAKAPLVVLLPSLGRGAEDFDPIAEIVAAAGLRVLRPQPRGIGHSHGCAYQDLEDCAGDIAAVIEAAQSQGNGGPAFLAGHAFGNRVSRLLATDRPDLVAAVSLIAANVGHAPSPPDVRAAIRNSANPDLPREERLEALRFAFFAPGNDAEGWLEGWYPHVLAHQRVAGDRTPRTRDYAGGGKPILYLQPSHDPLAHVEDAEIFRRENGSRVKVVIVPNASHAAIAEQPDFISRELIAYVRNLWPNAGTG
jgi:pimeloyl-ACP methyl ester carboxylesterase